MKANPYALILAGVMLLSGCATAQSDIGRPSPSTPSVTATPKRTTLPPVSLATSCNLLFGQNVDGPLADATDIVTRFVDAPDLSSVTETDLTGTIESLESARKNADPAITPYIDAQVAPLQQMLDAKHGKGSSTGTVHLDDFKASALELLNQCRPYL